MKKHLFYLVIILICNSCDKKSEIENRIVYELSEKASLKITEIYWKEKEQSGDDYFYVTISDSEQMYLTLNSCSEKDICIYSNDLFKKTNRFLKLNNNLYIPIFISADILFVQKTTNELSQKVGGGKIFKIDVDGNILEYGTTM